MNRTSKTTRVLLAAAFAVCLSACTGEGGSDPSAAPGAPSASGSAPQAASPAASTPAPPPETAPETAEASPPASSPSAPASPDIPGGRGLDEDVQGQVTMKGADSILIAGDDAGDRTAQLLPYTEVLDVQGGVCDEGAIPHRCSVDQLKKALKADVSLYAKVTIKDGVAVRIEELVRN
ncbi:hypothetical protein [Planomonospora sp. ID82291]|uniref:hypothetical protein n=1 Tax=Planomonospora sp. ID82291 TaxID=2738136 RepID=UPI0018C3A778|nr:hypothetical protein [Planomonospora sp. ID82291]MBG0813683.1 hypothetical protein [Planomonospora sp. ID82291]